MWRKHVEGRRVVGAKEIGGMGVEGRETADREAGAASAEADELAFGRERQLAEHLPPPQHTPISVCAVLALRCGAVCV